MGDVHTRVRPRQLSGRQRSPRLGFGRAPVTPVKTAVEWRALTAPPISRGWVRWTSWHHDRMQPLLTVRLSCDVRSCQSHRA